MKSIMYRVQHTTSYKYASAVRVSHNQVMLTPRGTPHSETHKHRLLVKPTPPTMHRREDYFGNSVHAFSLEDSHREMSISATAQVEVFVNPLQPDAESQPWESVIGDIEQTTDPRWLEAGQFRFASRRIPLSDEFSGYVKTSFQPKRPILEASLELTHRIFEDFEYDTFATHVNTPTPEAFEGRKGVCQDFAHVQIACLRSIGVSARYVSGYLRTLPAAGKERLVGADQSHAWVSVYCGPQLGWVDLDPTNKCLAGEGHITIAYGRDYDDVVPIRGVFLGGGEHEISVSVDVAPATESK